MGVMGAAVAARLDRAGIRVVTSTAGRSEVTRRRAAESGARELASIDAVVADADVVLSITGSAQAPVLAHRIAEAVAATGSAVVVAECNLLEPSVMIGLGETLGAAGARVVDAGIVGPPPDDARSPLFYLSGPDTAPLDFLARAGIPTRVVSARVGDASALKVASAAVWQGCLALIADVLLMTERRGLMAELLDDLRRNQTQLHGWFLDALEEAVPRAARWSGDMAAISRTMASGGSSEQYHAAAAVLYGRLAGVARDTGGDAGVGATTILTELAAVSMSGAGRGPVRHEGT